MKLRFGNLACLLGAVLLSGCGGDLAGGPDNLDTLQPIEQGETTIDGPQPPADASVITASGYKLLDVAGNDILLRGISLDYGQKPDSRLDGISPIESVGSNVVRIVVDESTTADQLDAALGDAMLNGLVAMVTLDSPDKLMCVESNDFLFEAVNTLWLGRWLPVLARAEYQPHLMINIANGWGPVNVWNANSVGYDSYIDNYKRVISTFRDVGFKVPLVIDAPHCGQDFYGFLSSRARELLVADSEQNLVLSLHAFGARWGGRTNVSDAMNQLAIEGLPIVVTEFGDSRAETYAINHMDLIEEAMGGKATILDIPWASEEDVAGFAYSLNEPSDFTQGGDIIFDFYIDSAYKADGKLAYQAFLVDTGGRYARLGINSIDRLGASIWNTVDLELKKGMTAADVASMDDGFDLTSIAQVGLEILANGKPVDVMGAIRIDNLIVGTDDTGASNPNAIFEDSFVGGRNWTMPYGAGGADTVWQENGELNIQGPWTASSDGSQAVTCDTASLSTIDLLAPMQLSMDVFVPAEYAVGSANIKFMFNDPSYRYAEFGRVNLTSLNTGEWNTVRVNIDEFGGIGGSSSAGFDVSQPPRCLGLAVGGITSSKTVPLRVDNYRITPLAEPPEKQTIYEATFDFEEAWRVVYGAGVGEGEDALSVVDNALALLPAWGQLDDNGNLVDQAILGFEGTSAIRPRIDLTKPITFSMKVRVPIEYADDSIFIQFMMNDYTWQNTATFAYTTSFNYYDAENPENNEDGGWTTISRTINDINADYGYMGKPGEFVVDQVPRSIGVQIGSVSTEKTQPILIDDFRLEQEMGVVLPETVLINIDFETQADVDGLLVSHVGGPVWSASSLANAKSLGNGLNPFGWIAQSWFGLSEPDDIFNISNSEGSLDITPRGEDIINSENGIGNTATEVSF